MLDVLSCGGYEGVLLPHVSTNFPEENSGETAVLAPLYSRSELRDVFPGCGSQPFEAHLGQKSIGRCDCLSAIGYQRSAVTDVLDDALKSAGRDLRSLWHSRKKPRAGDVVDRERLSWLVLDKVPFHEQLQLTNRLIDRNRYPSRPGNSSPARSNVPADRPAVYQRSASQSGGVRPFSLLLLPDLPEAEEQEASRTNILHFQDKC